jgi:hypothetical protein
MTETNFQKDDLFEDYCRMCESTRLFRYDGRLINVDRDRAALAETPRLIEFADKHNVTCLTCSYTGTVVTSHLENVARVESARYEPIEELRKRNVEMFLKAISGYQMPRKDSPSI